MLCKYDELHDRDRKHARDVVNKYGVEKDIGRLYFANVNKPLIVLMLKAWCVENSHMIFHVISADSKQYDKLRHNLKKVAQVKRVSMFF